MSRDLVGAVLAGGESRRMGRDKARLPLGGVALAARALGVLETVFDEVALVTGQERDYPDLDCVRIRDRFPGAGPLAGLEAAGRWAGERAVFVLACDLPRVDGAIVRRMVEAGHPGRSADNPGAAAAARVALRAGRRQPLCALYSPGCGRLAASLLGAGRRSLRDLLASADVEFVAFDDVFPDPFLNVNTPADFETAGGLRAAFR